MTDSLAFVSARDELLQRLPGIGQVAAWEALPACETLPQPDETFRVIGKAHCAAGMRELGLKIAVFPLGNRRDVGALRQAHGARTDVASRTIRVPVGSGLETCIRIGARTHCQRPHVEVFACYLEDERRVREDEAVELPRFFRRHL